MYARCIEAWFINCHPQFMNMDQESYLPCGQDGAIIPGETLSQLNVHLHMHENEYKPYI